MLVAGISQAQVQRGKRQRRRGALLVAPLDLGVADDDVFLPEQPVGEATLAVRRQRGERPAPPPASFMPALERAPSASRRTSSRGPSMASECSRTWPYSSE